MNISSFYYNKVWFLECHLLWSFQTWLASLLSDGRDYTLTSMKDIQVLHVFCVSCQRPQLCFLQVIGVSDSAAQMPDQSISGDRGVQMGANRYFMLRRMVIFGTFMVHIGKTRMNTKFFDFIGSKRNKIRGKKVQIKRKTSQNITQIR